VRWWSCCGIPNLGSQTRLFPGPPATTQPMSSWSNSPPNFKFPACNPIRRTHPQMKRQWCRSTLHRARYQSGQRGSLSFSKTDGDGLRRAKLTSHRHGHNTRGTGVPPRKDMSLFSPIFTAYIWPPPSTVPKQPSKTARRQNDERRHPS
jgi:hypothetical protein